MKYRTLIIFAVLAVLGVGAYILILFDRSRLEKRAPAGWRQLQIGMTSQQVESLLGSADEVSFFLPTGSPVVLPPPTEDWCFSFDGTRPRFVVSFATGRVVSFQVR